MTIEDYKVQEAVDLLGEAAKLGAELAVPPNMALTALLLVELRELTKTINNLPAQLRRSG